MPRRQFDELILQQLAQPNYLSTTPTSKNSLSLKRQDQLRSKRPDFWHQLTVNWTVRLLIEIYQVGDAAVSDFYFLYLCALKQLLCSPVINWFSGFGYFAKSGMTYSQTVSPSGVTSNSLPNALSQMNVFPFHSL